MHHLRISLTVDSEEDLDRVRELLTDDLELSLDGACKVVNITHDRELASTFTKAQRNGCHEVLCHEVPPPPLAPDIAAVLSCYGFTLPKSWLKKGAPPIRVPQKDCVGEIQGLHNLRGKVVLTNGIMAFLVRLDGRWSEVHWNHFVPDDLEACEDLPPREVKERVNRKLEAVFGEF